MYSGELFNSIDVHLGFAMLDFLLTKGYLRAQTAVIRFFVLIMKYNIIKNAGLVLICESFSFY